MGEASGGPGTPREPGPLPASAFRPSPPALTLQANLGLYPTPRLSPDPAPRGRRRVIPRPRLDSRRYLARTIWCGGGCIFRLAWSRGLCEAW